MLKTAATCVLNAQKRHWALAGHGRLTVSPAFTTVTRLLRRVVNLVPVRTLDRS